MNTISPQASVVFGSFAIAVAVVCALTPGVSLIFQTPFIGSVLALGVAAYVGYDLSQRAGRATHLHPYVWALLFGLALSIPLAPLVGDTLSLTFTVELLAAILLFAGGLSLPIRNLGKYLGPIAVLSVVGSIIGAALFAFVLDGFTTLTGYLVPFSALFVLGLLLAPSDPLSLRSASRTLASVRPTLKSFAETEGTANDIVGVVAVRLVLVALLTIAGTGFLSGEGLLSTLVGPQALLLFAFEMGWGVLVALLGAWILRAWGHPIRHGSFMDRLPFFIVPFFSYALGAIAGAGFLAAFLTGLFYEERAGHAVSRVHFDRFAYGVVGPMSFVLLGALVPIADLTASAGLGIFAAVALMLVVRPATMAIALFPWYRSAHPLVTFKETLFLSFLREAGPISVVLLMLVFASGIAGGVQVLALGTWVILTLLLLEPAIVGSIAHRLGVTHHE